MKQWLKVMVVGGKSERDAGTLRSALALLDPKEVISFGHYPCEKAAIRWARQNIHVKPIEITFEEGEPSVIEYATAVKSIRPDIVIGFRRGTDLEREVVGLSKMVSVIVLQREVAKS